jgi:hypothetical protein
VLHFIIKDGKEGTVSVALAAVKLLNQRVVPYSFHQHVRREMILTHSPSKVQGPLLRSICQHREKNFLYGLGISEIDMIIISER